MAYPLHCVTKEELNLQLVTGWLSDLNSFPIGGHLYIQQCLPQKCLAVSQTELHVICSRSTCKL